MMRKQYVSQRPVKCIAVPLYHGEPMSFEIGKVYHFVQQGRVFVLYNPYRTDIKIGYRQFKECFV